ncbi:SDR family oxidoreductase [Cupriavidus respiraculi]|uniref:Glucose 1-dehydrogenase 2 n=1 Tax=Cupriavidus respiraculi TaxID=195930 RepID=A0ABN7ZIN7_9BURK|nr:SDR family oxidoreductase [Cupriavidus respiraculi]CAG9183959.1 Glucose 1-dehydrogenase 2 [Cupriavidus respiraculi]
MGRRVVLVTGAAKRAGRAFAEYFSERGDALVVHYGASASEAASLVASIRLRGGTAVAMQADLRDPEQIRVLVERAYRHYGKVDVLINNASVFGQDAFSDFNVETLEEAWLVNYRAPILLARAFYDLAKAANATGVVVNVVDQKVKGSFHKDHFTYTVGKAGIGNLTQMLAISAHPVLRVNAVFPGLMLESDDQTADDFAYASRHATPLGVIATPEDVAGAIDLLTSPAYNGFDFLVDGGQHLVKRTQDVLYEHRAPKNDE